MILVDTSVWVDHLRTGVPTLARALETHGVLVHRWVVGELALGDLSNRAGVLALLRALPQCDVAEPEELLHMIERVELHGRGIGYVDAQLLAATQLTPGARLWSRDRRLADAATQLGLRYDSAR
jgi:predicted nucleic acid-binding protein